MLYKYVCVEPYPQIEHKDTKYMRDMLCANISSLKSTNAESLLVSAYFDIGQRTYFSIFI